MCQARACVGSVSLLEFVRLSFWLNAFACVQTPTINCSVCLRQFLLQASNGAMQFLTQ